MLTAVEIVSVFACLGSACGGTARVAERLWHRPRPPDPDQDPLRLLRLGIGVATTWVLLSLTLRLGHSETVPRLPACLGFAVGVALSRWARCPRVFGRDPAPPT